MKRIILALLLCLGVGGCKTSIPQKTVATRNREGVTIVHISPLTSVNPTNGAWLYWQLVGYDYTREGTTKGIVRFMTSSDDWHLWRYALDEKGARFEIKHEQVENIDVPLEYLHQHVRSGLTLRVYDDQNHEYVLKYPPTYIKEFWRRVEREFLKVP
jgi:hypothetical protein